MKLLLDENIPRNLSFDLTEHEVKTVSEMNWSGIKNGALIKQLLEEKFDCLITADRNLQFQHNFKKYPVPILVLVAERITYPHLKVLIPKILLHLKKGVKPGITEIK